MLRSASRRRTRRTRSCPIPRSASEQFFGSGSPFGGAAGSGAAGGFQGGGFEYVDLSDLGGTGTGARARAIPAAQATADVTLAEVATGTERLVNVNGRRLHVKIPAGVGDGSKVKLSGAADGRDVVINVKVTPDPRFERSGADLRTELPLTLEEALLGAEVPVPTPTGSVKLRIRPNTQNGQVITAKGRGLPKRGSSQKGDLVVTARIVLPKLDDDQRTTLEPVLREIGQPSPRTRG
jgi:curved DNA-binding protein